jgi:Uma2 family endonuclease
MAAAISPPESGVILDNVSYEIYEGLLAAHPDSASPRFAYDDGRLEIMILSRRHEHPNRTLAQIVEIIAEEFVLNIARLGSMTCKRDDLLKGFEPDSCFYIQNLDAIADKEEIDFSVDPPPDLVIEIDITHPSLPKFPIFAAFGVPEVWRFDGQRVQIFKLENGRYVETDASLALPPLTGEVLTNFLADSGRMKSVAWIRRVREWAQSAPLHR